MVLEPEASGWHFSAMLDCQHADTLGPYARVTELDVELYGARSMYQSFLIDVQAPGSYLVERTGAQRINYERCLEDDLATEEDIAEQRVQTVVWFNLQGIGMIELDAGLWRFDVLVDHGPVVDVSVTITPDPG